MSHRPIADSTATAGLAVRLVAGRELNTRLRTRSFIIGTIVILAALIGFFLLQSTLLSGADKSRIGVSGQATSIAGPLKQRASDVGLDIETEPVTDPGQGRELVRGGELDALVSGKVAEPQVLVKSDLNDRVRALLNGLAQSEVLRAQLAELGVQPDEVLDPVNSTSIDVTVIEQPDAADAQRKAVGVITVVLMFLGIMTYGSLVTQGVVEEKSSRVVEILLSTLRPWHLMLGKVIGLGLVGLIQLAIIGVVGIVVASVTGVLTISGAAAGMLAWGLLWYVLGFFMYATIFAAAGSLVSRQEEVQTVVTPVTMVLAIGYVVGINLILQDPESTTSTVVSMIPLFSPIMLPGRIAVGAAPVWQIALAVLLTLGTIALFTWVGSRIYHGAVLHTGSRLKLADALRS